MPADADPFTLPPALCTRADLVDDANHFMSGNAWIRHPGKEAVLCGYIAVTDSTRLNANPDLPRGRRRDLTFDDFEVRSRLRYLHRFHFCHVLFPPLAHTTANAADKHQRPTVSTSSQLPRRLPLPLYSAATTSRRGLKKEPLYSLTSACPYSSLSRGG